MHTLLEEFLDKWVWPTMPAPGAEFRLRITRERCIKGWELNLARTLADIEEELKTSDEAWKKAHALRGYAAEGVHMSIKQMSAQLLSVDIAEQEKYIDLQRMRARQIWDECKHSKLHSDVLLGKGWIADERELMDIKDANVQPLPAYFGLSMMFPVGSISADPIRQPGAEAPGLGREWARRARVRKIGLDAGIFHRAAEHRP